MGTTDGNGVYTPDLDEEGWDPELATNFDLFSQNITDHAAHVADTTDAHDASAVSFTPTGTIAATDVQAAIAEVASEAAAAGAPTTADYLVGTTQGGLSAEIVVGATPGGELGGTWASPTVDATHSGSAHHAAATEGTGIDISGQVISVDLSEISAGGELGGTMDAPTVDSSHAGGTHAATQAAAESTAATAASTHAAAADPHTGYQKESEKAAASGYASLDGSTKVPIAQVPTGTSSSTVALGDAAAGLITTHEAAGDPHTGYQKESEKAAASGYASLDGSTKIPLAQVPTGTSSSTVALGDAAAALDATHVAAADPHTGYLKESDVAAKGDLYVATANDTVGVLSAGTDFTTRLVTNSGQATGLAWVPYVVRKTSDQALTTSNTTLENVTGLVIAVAASEVYLFEMYLIASAASITPDIKFGWTVPSGTTMVWGAYVDSNVGASVGDLRLQAVATTPVPVTEATSLIAGLTSATSLMRLSGLIVASATPGNVQFQAAQSTSNAGATTVKANSTILLTRIA